LAKPSRVEHGESDRFGRDPDPICLGASQVKMFIDGVILICFPGIVVKE